MIKSIKEKSNMIEIDLTGPDGNVFNLISIATSLGKQFNRLTDGKYFDVKRIQEDMMSGDYEHAINVIEKNFGNYIILYR